MLDDLYPPNFSKLAYGRQFLSPISTSERPHIFAVSRTTDVYTKSD